MNSHIHTIDVNQHREFLNERRKDPFSKQELKAGDHIIFCAGCRSAFLISSWEAMGNRHRDCSDETLAEFYNGNIQSNSSKLNSQSKFKSYFIVGTDTETSTQLNYCKNTQLLKENDKNLISNNTPSLTQYNNIIVVELYSFGQTKQVIDFLKKGKLVILNLTNVIPDEVQRCIDFIEGGALLLNTQSHKIGKGIFLYIPSNYQNVS